MAELLRTHLLGERAAGVRADGSLGLRASRDPEVDEPGAALVERTYLVAPPRQLLVGGVDVGKGTLEVLVDIRHVAHRRPPSLRCWLGVALSVAECSGLEEDGQR